MTQELDDLALGDHLLDPDHAVARLAQPIHAGGHLGADLRRVRLTGAEHELDRRVEPLRGADEVGDALLAGDPAHEHDRGARRVHAAGLEHVDIRIGRVLLGVDAVVDHHDARGLDRRIGRHHVARHALRHGDHRVGALQRGPLRPGRERVAAAELLGLPRALGLERVRRDHVRHVVGQRRQVAGEVRVPRVRVHDVAVARRRGHRQIGRERAQRGELGPVPGQRVPGAVSHHRRRPVGRSRRAPGVDDDVLQARQLAREVLDVHPGAAVDLGRVLACQQPDLHDAASKRTTPPSSRSITSPRSTSRSTWPSTSLRVRYACVTATLPHSSWASS